MKAGPFLVSYTKINSKWSRDLSGRPETIKRLEENTGGELHDNGMGNDFLDATLKAQATEANKQMKLHQKNLLHTKKAVNRAGQRGTGPCHQRTLTPSWKSDIEQCSHNHL